LRFFLTFISYDFDGERALQSLLKRRKKQKAKSEKSQPPFQDFNFPPPSPTQDQKNFPIHFNASLPLSFSVCGCVGVGVCVKDCSFFLFKIGFKRKLAPLLDSEIRNVGGGI
jgi:hypothetical protein